MRHEEPYNGREGGYVYPFIRLPYDSLWLQFTLTSLIRLFTRRTLPSTLACSSTVNSSNLLPKRRSSTYKFPCCCLRCAKLRRFRFCRVLNPGNVVEATVVAAIILKVLLSMRSQHLATSLRKCQLQQQRMSTSPFRPLRKPTRRRGASKSPALNVDECSTNWLI